MSQELNPNIQEIRNIMGVVSEPTPKNEAISDNTDLNALRIKVLGEKLMKEVKGLY